MDDMLAVFPELIETYEVFKMKPHTGGGYGERYDKRKVRGYWSWRQSARVGIAGDLNVPDHQATFWMQSYLMERMRVKKVLIEENDFIEVDDRVYRVVRSNNFTKEGGFYKCLMQRLAGPTDRQVTNGRVDGAIAADY